MKRATIVGAAVLAFASTAGSVAAGGTCGGAGLLPWQPDQWTLETEGDPTLHDFALMKIKAPMPGAIWYKLERVTDAGGQTLHSDSTYPRWTDRLQYVFRFTGEFVNTGTAHIRISAWSEPPSDMWGDPGNDGSRISEYDVRSIAFNHSYEGIDFTLDVAGGPAAVDPALAERYRIVSDWDCLVRSVPFWEGGDPPQPIEELAAQTNVFTWTLYQPTGQLDPATQLPKFAYAGSSSLRSAQTVDNGVKLTFGRPGIYYVALELAWSGTRGYGSRHTLASGLTPSPMPRISGQHIPYPIVLPPTGIDPAEFIENNLALNYPVAQQPPVVLPSVPGDQRVPPLKDRVTLFDGGRWSVPLGPAEGFLAPTHFEIDLPAGELTLRDTAYLTSSSQSRYGYTVHAVQVPGTELGENALWPGYHRYRLDQVSLNYEWSYQNWNLPLYFDLEPAAMDGAQRTIRIRPVGSEGDTQNTPGKWSELEVTYAALPEVTLPRRLVTSLTWARHDLFADTNVESFLDTYRSLGLNTVPAVSSQSFDPVNEFSRYLFTEAERSGPAWDGLFYGLEHGTFGRGWYNGNVYQPGMVELLTTWVNGNCPAFVLIDDLEPCLRGFLADPGEFGLFEPELTLQTDKWLAALQYYHFDSPAGSPKFDVAYDGIIRDRDLQQLTDVIAYTVPDYLFIDSESFPWFYTDWLRNVSRSSLAEARRLVGETDRELAYRLANELLDAMIGAIRGACTECGAVKIGLYDSGATYNYGYQVFTWDLQNGPNHDPAQQWTHDLISQRSVYGLSRDLDRYVEELRQERRSLEASLVPGRELEMIPWFSTGAAGEVDSDSVFDMLAHTFINGATGFCYWAPTHLDDMADLLGIADAVRTLAWPEARYVRGLDDVAYPKGINGEDVVFDGQLAEADISAIVPDPGSGEPSAIVSAMKLDGLWLVAVTPQSETTPVGFTISTGDPGAAFLLQDLRFGGQRAVLADLSGEVNFDATTFYGGPMPDGTTLRLFPASACSAPFEAVAIPTADRTATGDAVLWVADHNPGIAVTGYNIYRATDPAGPFELIAQNEGDTDPVAPGVQYEDTGSGGGPSYYYRVRAFNAGCVAEGP